MQFNFSRSDTLGVQGRSDVHINQFVRSST